MLLLFYFFKLIILKFLLFKYLFSIFFSQNISLKILNCIKICFLKLFLNLTYLINNFFDKNAFCKIIYLVI